MTLVIARSQNQRIAHFFDPEQQIASDNRKALCGFTCAVGQLEALSDFGGALPCELCVRDVPGDQLVSTHQDPPEAFPADDEDSAETYAVALHGEALWHRVPPRPQLHTYEGRDVVITECGRIAFLLFGTPPDRYEPCPDCPPEQ